MVSDQVAEVDGTPRHVCDIRHRISRDRGISTSDDSCEDLVVTFPSQEEQCGEEDLERNNEDAGSVALRRSTRIRQPTKCLMCD